MLACLDIPALSLLVPLAAQMPAAAQAAASIGQRLAAADQRLPQPQQSLMCIPAVRTFPALLLLSALQTCSGVACWRPLPKIIKAKLLKAAAPVACTSPAGQFIAVGVSLGELDACVAVLAADLKPLSWVSWRQCIRSSPAQPDGPALPGASCHPTITAEMAWAKYLSHPFPHLTSRSKLGSNRKQPIAL